MAWSSGLPSNAKVGELAKKRPSQGAKRRWQDVVAADVKSVGVRET